jgi:hypothetical protein
MYKRVIICLVAMMLIPFSAKAVAVAPATIEVEGVRGGIAKTTFSIINTSATDQTYYLGTMKFEPKEESGAPQFIPYEEDHSGLAEWMKLPSSSLVVPANTKNEYELNVQIPSDVESGGYYAALTVSGSPQDLVAANGAIVDAKTALLVFLTVKGELVRKAEILDLKKTSGISSMSEGYVYRVQNQGNVHVIPEAEIIFTGMFGREIGRVDANSAKGRVLPGTTRKFIVTETEEGGIFKTASTQMRALALGRVKAELRLNYGNSNEEVSAETKFWYIPVHLLAVTLGVLIILAAGIKSTKRKKRG